MKYLVLIMCILFAASCDEWVDQIKDLRSDYANPRFHENGIDPETPHNAEIGKDWMDNVFYPKWPMKTVIKPNGCSNFDKIYYVSTYGSDTNSGYSATPFATVQKAIDIASNDECTLIKVLRGQYRQTITLNRKKNITIFGADRITTQLLSKKELKGWQVVRNDECLREQSCHTLKLTFEGHLPNNYHLLYKDKVSIPMYSLARFSFREVIQPQDLVDPTILDNIEYINDLPNLIISSDLRELTTSGKERFKDHAIKIMEGDTSAYLYMNSGVMARNDLSWNGVGSSYYVHRESDTNGNPISTIYFRNYDNDESAFNHISTHLGYSSSIIDSQNIVIQNLSLYNGRYGVAVKRDSHDVKIIGNLLRGHFRAIYIYGDFGYGRKIAPSNIEVYGNQVTNNLDLNFSPQFEGAYRNFNLVKKGLSDAHGVNLYNVGENIDIHHNFIYNVGNGVQAYNDNKVDYQTIDLKVHHNLIINTLDDGLEPGGSCINCRWYANHLRNSSQSVRLKIRDINSIGPVYIYENVFYNNDKYNYTDTLTTSNQTTFYYHTASSIPVYVYNNTFLGFRCFLMPTRDSDKGGPNLYFLNNIFSCKYSMPNARLGAWPSPNYNPALQEYDDEGNPIPMFGNKNSQPLHSHNWVGGTQDIRETVTSSSGNVRALYETEKLHIFAYSNGGNPLNYVYRSESDETPIHIFDYFNQERSHVLERTDFCTDKGPYSETKDEGLNLNNIENLTWQYTELMPYYNSTLYHLIDRTITDELPSSFNSSFPIGAFNDNFRCKDFNWLLGKD